MAQIRNRSDLKTAYEVLREIQTLKPLPGRESSTLDYIHQLKRDIREFFRHQEKDIERQTILDEGIGGYIELVKLPDFLHTREDAAAYFEERAVHRCPNLPGGCTGLAFTCWYRIVCRQGKMWVYHRVSYDV